MTPPLDMRITKGKHFRSMPTQAKALLRGLARGLQPQAEFTAADVASQFDWSTHRVTMNIKMAAACLLENAPWIPELPIGDKVLTVRLASCGTRVYSAHTIRSRSYYGKMAEIRPILRNLLGLRSYMRGTSYVELALESDNSE